MIKKLAIIAIEKADGTVKLQAGEKGEIREFARDLIRALNDNPGHDVAQVTALGSDGILKRRKWKENWPSEVAPATISPVAEAPAPEAPADDPETPADLPAFDGDPDEEEDAPEVEASEDDEAKALRKKLRDAGIQYSPRAGIEWLRNRVAEAGL